MKAALVIVTTLVAVYFATGVADAGVAVVNKRAALIEAAVQ